MQGRFYPEVFSKQGIKIIPPEPDDQEYIHDKYMSELVFGIFLPEIRQRLLSIVDRLKEKEGIQAVILGGTELPLILRKEDEKGIPFLDTTRIHVTRAVTQMLA